MDRAEAVNGSERNGIGRDPNDEFVLPSRRAVLDTLAAALDEPRGPVVLTGEPGVGKTWLCRTLVSSLPLGWRWARIDLGPAVEADELHRLIAHAMKVAQGRGSADSRALIADVLEDAAADGERWGLIVEEAQDAPTAVLDELRILSNRIGEPGAFAGVILVGQTPLARRLMLRSLAPLEVRISARAHLRSLNLDELRAWLEQISGDQTWNERDLERLHRETAGNPRRVLARGIGIRQSVPALSRPKINAPSQPVELVTTDKIETPSPKTSNWDAPMIAVAKPPIQVGDGMIEVGWEASSTEQGPVVPRESILAERRASVAVLRNADDSEPEGSEEVIDDHYAALQAWTEWAKNQGRDPIEVGRMERANDDGTEPDDAEVVLDPDENPSARISGLAGVRAEGHHEFAPYSQLFSRLRQKNESQ